MTPKTSIELHIELMKGTPIQEAHEMMKTALTALPVESLAKIVDAKVTQTIAEIDINSMDLDKDE